MKKLIIFLIAAGLLAVKNIQAQQTDTLPCPTIVLSAPAEYKVTDGNEAVFTVEPFSKAYEQYSLTYHWTLSIGSISKGQGTNTVYIDTRGLRSQAITVTVELGGLKPNCLNIKSSTIDVVEGKASVKTKTKGK
jgi:hypothetical protein